MVLMMGRLRLCKDSYEDLSWADERIGYGDNNTMASENKWTCNGQGGRVLRKDEKLGYMIPWDVAVDSFFRVRVTTATTHNLSF